MTARLDPDAVHPTTAVLAANDAGEQVLSRLAAFVPLLPTGQKLLHLLENFRCHQGLMRALDDDRPIGTNRGESAARVITSP